MLTAEQQAIRSTGVGASEVPAVVGLSPYATAIDVWARKVGLAEPVAETVAMRVGNAVEPAVATLYEQDRGCKLLLGETTRHRIFGWAIATPDRIVEGDGRLVEIKTVGARMARDWGADAEDAIPEYVRAQVEWQMLVCGARRCDVAALIGGTDFRIYQIERDDELGAMLLDLVGRFWTEHVLTREPPAIDASLSARRAIEARFPCNGGAMLRATPDADAWARKAAAARKALADATAAKEEAENHLRAIIGDADGIAGDGWKATWKAPKPTRVVAWEDVARAAGATDADIARHTTERQGARRFLVSGSMFKGEE